MAGVDARDGRDLLPGQGLERPAQSLLVAFDGEHVAAALIADPLGGVHLCVHGICDDHYPVEVEGLEKLSDGGDLWMDLSATRTWLSTAPMAWSRADRRCGAEACPRRAPRTVLPSIAMTVLLSTVPVGVHNHDLRRVLRSVGSRSCGTRRMVDCRRQGLPRLQAQGPQIRRGQVGGVLPDGRQAPAACEHSRHGQGQDREQAVAHAPPIPGGGGDVPKEPGPGAGATGQTWWRMTSARAPRTRR